MTESNNALLWMDAAKANRRSIDDKMINDFIAYSKDAPSKGDVIIGTQKHGTSPRELALAREAQFFKYHIEKMLARAGYSVVDRKQYDCWPRHIGESYIKFPIAIADGASQEAASRSFALAEAFGRVLHYPSMPFRSPEYFRCATNNLLLGTNDVVIFILSLPEWERTDVTDPRIILW